MFLSLFYLRRQYLTSIYIFKTFQTVKKIKSSFLYTNFSRGVNLIYCALLCRVVDFKGAELQFYETLIGVHAKVLLDPKDLKP